MLGQRPQHYPYGVGQGHRPGTFARGSKDIFIYPVFHTLAAPEQSTSPPLEDMTGGYRILLG